MRNLATRVESPRMQTSRHLKGQNMSEQHSETPEETESRTSGSKLVPVSESIKYRKRAQQAESQSQETEQQLKEAQKQLHDHQEQLATAEAQRDEARLQLTVAENRLIAERMLSESGVVDIETASLLLSKRLNISDQLPQETLVRSVEQLLLDKPFLRNTNNVSLPPKTASAKGVLAATAAQLAEAADQAIRTGDRRDVAEYLRLRRQTATH